MRVCIYANISIYLYLFIYIHGRNHLSAVGKTRLLVPFSTPFSQTVAGGRAILQEDLMLSDQFNQKNDKIG